MWFWVTAQGTFHWSLKDSLQYSLWGRFAGEFSHFLCTWKCLNFSFISEGGFRQRIVGWKPFLSALWRHHPTVVWLPWFLMRSQQFILLISLLTDNVQFIVKIWLNIKILKFIDFSHFAYIFLVLEGKWVHGSPYCGWKKEVEDGRQLCVSCLRPPPPHEHLLFNTSFHFQGVLHLCSMNTDPSGFQWDFASLACTTPVSCLSHKSPEQEEMKQKLEDEVGSQRTQEFRDALPPSHPISLRQKYRTWFSTERVGRLYYRGIFTWAENRGFTK